MVEQGNGRADAAAALQTDTLSVPSTLSFGAITAGRQTPASRSLQIINASDETGTYEITPLMDDSTMATQVMPATFTLAPGAVQQVRVQVTTNDVVRFDDSEQRLEVHNHTTGSRITIPVWARALASPPAEASILLIDDDQGVPAGESFEGFYLNRLDRLGEQAVHWGVADRGGFYPALDYLQQFDVVIWYMAGSSLFQLGTQSSRPFIDGFNERSLFETDLMRYLGNGGRLLLSGMDFFDGKEESIFPLEALGSRMAVHDHGANSITGVDGSPVGDGIPTFSVMPGVLEDFTDLLSMAGEPIAQPAFFVNGDPDRVAGMTVDACNYRAVFLTFPLEVLPDEGAEQILAHSLRWLRETEPVPGTVSFVTPSLVDLDRVEGTIPLTIHGEGFSFAGGYQASIGFTPVENLRRVDCTTLEGTLPATLAPGTYSLSLVNGNGIRYEVNEAITFQNGGPTRIPAWMIY